MNKSKYQIGDEVWKISYDSKAVKRTIVGIRALNKGKKYSYSIELDKYGDAEGYYCKEEILFPSKQELIDSL